MKAILGEKLGMTQIFDDEARSIPVTVVKAGPVRVAPTLPTFSHFVVMEKRERKASPCQSWPMAMLSAISS